MSKQRISYAITYVQKRRDGIAMNVNHLQIRQTVNATHTQSHNAQDKCKPGQRTAQRYDDHADRYNSCVDQQYVIRVNSESIYTQIM